MHTIFPLLVCLCKRISCIISKANFRAHRRSAYKPGTTTLVAAINPNIVIIGTYSYPENSKNPRRGALCFLNRSWLAFSPAE